MDGYNSLSINNASPVDADKFSRIQSGLQVCQRFTQQILLPSAVQLHIVVRGLDPIDAVARYKLVAICIPDDQSLRPLARLTFQQRFESLRQSDLMVLRDPLSCSFDGVAQARFLKRF